MIKIKILKKLSCFGEKCRKRFFESAEALVKVIYGERKSGFEFFSKNFLCVCHSDAFDYI